MTENTFLILPLNILGYPGLVSGGKEKSKRREKSAWGESEEPLRREPG